MINREWQDIKVRTYTSGTDAYGQTRQSGYTERNARAVIKQYDAQNVANPDFLRVTKIALTDDLTISPNDAIQVDTELYNIKYIIPAKKYLELFMVKK